MDKLSHTHDLDYSDPLPGLPEKCASEAHKPTEREPMLNCDEFVRITAGRDLHELHQIVADWYEAKITSGELITKEEHQRLLKEAEDAASFRWSE